MKFMDFLKDCLKNDTFRAEWEKDFPDFDVDGLLNEGMEKKVINIREELNRLDYETNCQYDLINLYEAAELDSQARKDLVKFLAQGEDADFIGNFLSQKYGAKCSDDLCEETFAESRDEDEFILDNADDMGFWFDEIQGDEEKEQRVAGVKRQYLKKTSSLDEDIDGEEPKHLGDVIGNIDFILVYGDIDDAHLQSNYTLLKEADDDFDSYDEETLLDMSDEQFLKVSDTTLNNVKNVEVLDRLARLDKTRLTPEQLKILEDEYKNKYIVDKDDVQKFLDEIKKCDNIVIVPTAKNQKFIRENKLTSNDCLSIIHGLDIKDYYRNTKSFIYKNLGNKLIIFEPKDVVLSDGRNLGDLVIYVKLDIDDSTNSTVSAVSIHNSDENKQNDLPYKDDEEEITEENTLTESGLHMDDYHISDREMLTVGWEKDKGFVVAKIWRPDTNTNTWRTEWERTYPSEEGAKRAFKRYVSKLSENLSEAKDPYLEPWTPYTRRKDGFNSSKESYAHQLAKNIFGLLSRDPQQDDGSFEYIIEYILGLDNDRRWVGKAPYEELSQEEIDSIYNSKSALEKYLLRYDVQTLARYGIDIERILLNKFHRDAKMIVEAKDTERSRANRRDKISGKFNVPYTLTLKNQYNYTVIQYRIDPKNKTIEKGLFNWGDGKGSFFKNRKELQRHVDDLLAQGYKMVESKEESMAKDLKRASKQLKESSNGVVIGKYIDPSKENYKDVRYSQYPNYDERVEVIGGQTVDVRIYPTIEGPGHSAYFSLKCTDGGYKNHMPYIYQLGDYIERGEIVLDKGWEFSKKYPYLKKVDTIEESKNNRSKFGKKLKE